jgi:3-hydroxyisobutyrate dehydrogenase
MTNIAFIGLGHMGRPMVQNLIKAGHNVMVFDVVPEAIASVEKIGAIAGSSVADMAKHADMMITMVQTGEQVSSLCLGEQGLFAHARPGTLYADCSSIDIATCRLLHEQAEKLGICMIDAPVSGGMKGAEAGTLTFMVGGTKENFLKIKSFLENMGKNIIHAGDAGNGQAAKICNNMILGISMIAVSEAFGLAERLGLSAEKLYEISTHASGQCWALTVNPPIPGLVETAPANRDYEPGFAAKMMLKDLKLSQNAAQHLGASTPLGAEATALYSMYVNQGQGEKDFSGIVQMIKGKEVN